MHFNPLLAQKVADYAPTMYTRGYQITANDSILRGEHLAQAQTRNACYCVVYIRDKTPLPSPITSLHNNPFIFAFYQVDIGSILALY